MFDMIADQRIASCPPRGRESLGGQLTVYFLFEYGEATFVAIELVCDAKSGTLYWSCPQVESGRMANAFNLVTDGDFSLTTNNTAASTTRLFPKQWKVTGNGVSTSTLNCIVTDRAVNGLPDSVSRIALPLMEAGRPFTARSVTTQFKAEVLRPVPVAVHCFGNSRGVLPAVLFLAMLNSPSLIILKRAMKSTSTRMRRCFYIYSIDTVLFFIAARNHKAAQ